MRGKIIAFGRFWYDFVIGDDWRIAVGVAFAFAITYAVSRSASPAWWIVPAAVPVLLACSVWRAARNR
jgi:hypothetical protein